MVRTLAGVLAVLAPVAAVAASPFDGTWVLDAARSQRTGALMHVAGTPETGLTVAETGLSFTFRCDGRDYSLPGGRTLACERVSGTELRLTGSQNGTVLAITERTLSPDGRTMTAVVDGRDAAGRPFHKTTILARRDGSPGGWAGTWEDKSVTETTPDRFTATVAGGILTLAEPAAGTTLTAKLDGTPTHQTGDRATTGELLTFTETGPRHIDEADSVAGHPVETDAIDVDAASRMLTITSRHTGDPAPQILVYRRQ